MSKLVLFDIDETMIKSDGVGRRSITRALRELTGVAVDSSAIMLSGKTDPQICREILEANGLSANDLSGGLERVYEAYLPILEAEINRSDAFTLHCGVRELVNLLAEREDVSLALLTGNIEAGARLKLAPFDLNRYFPTGAFGCDSADRMDLPAIACRRSSDFFAVEFSPAETVVIGDSVNDVACAHGFGARCVAVATGKTPWSDLSLQEPEFLFESLADTKAVLQAICHS
jgi:phosphoglycolate phosphatase-like HAD superfamily hydrolase